MAEITKESVRILDVLHNPEWRHLFKKYLEAHRKEESLLFLESVWVYRKTKEQLNRFVMASNIINFYLKDSSRHQLNISEKDRDLFMHSFNQMSSVGSWHESMFDGLHNVVVSQLSEESLPVFLKNNTLQVNQKQDCEVITGNDANSPVLYGVIDQTEIDEQRAKLAVTDQDFAKFDEFFQDSSMWKLSQTRRGGNEELHRTNRLLPGFVVKAFKHNLIADSDLLSALAFYLDFNVRSEVDEDILSSEIVDMIPGDGVTSFSTVIYHESYKMPFPFGRREALLRCSLRYVPDKNIFVLLREPINHPKRPISNEIVRVEYM